MTRTAMIRAAIVLLAITIGLTLSACEGWEEFWELPPDAEEYVSISNATISYINSVWLVYVDVTIENVITEEVAETLTTDESTVKYAYFTAKAYNRVGDPIMEDIWEYYTFEGEYVGPLAPKESETGTWEVGYFTGVDYVEVQLDEVEMMDGTTLFASTDAEVASTKDSRTDS